jgi:hypothetical protein
MNQILQMLWVCMTRGIKLIYAGLLAKGAKCKGKRLQFEITIS